MPLQETEAGLVTLRNENARAAVLVYMRVCAERAHVHICTHVWWPDVSLLRYSLQIACFSFETGSLVSLELPTQSRLG